MYIILVKRLVTCNGFSHLDIKLQKPLLYNHHRQNVRRSLHDGLVLIDFQIKKASIMWGKVFKNGPSKICGKQSLKNLNSIFLKPVFHKSYLSILKYFPSFQLIT